MNLSDHTKQLIHACSKDEAAFQRLITLFESTTDSRQQYDALLEQTQDAIFILDMNGYYQQVNHRAARMLGYTPAEITHLHITNIAVDQHKSQQVMTQLRNGMMIPPFDCVFRHKDGSVIPVEVNIRIIGTVIQCVVKDTSTRREDEMLLSQKYAELDRFFHVALDLLCIADADGRFLKVNRAWENLLGYSAHELQGRSFLDFVHPDDLQPTREAMAVLDDNQPVLNFINRYRSVDGSYRYIEWRSYSYENLYYAAARDVTDRTQSHASQQEFVEDMRALQALYLELSGIDSLPELYQKMVEMTCQRMKVDRARLMLIDPAGTVLQGVYGVDMNGAIIDERQYQEQITLDHWTQAVLNAPDHVLFQDDGTLEWQMISALWNGHQVIGYLITDNKLTHHPARLYEAELTSLLGSTFGRLIEGKQSEAALRESEARFSAIFRNSPVPMVICSGEADNRRYVDANDAYLQLVGYAWDELSNRTVTEVQIVIHDADREGQMTQLEQTRQFTMREGRIRRGKGDIRYVMMSARRLKTASGTYDIEILIDITERKHIEQQEFELALERERLWLLQQFIEKASHEFRTPLSIINSSAYLIARMDDADKRQIKADQIAEQIHRVTRLVDTLLLMVKLDNMDAMSQARVNVASTLEGVCQKVASEYENMPRLTFQKQSNVPSVLGNIRYLINAFRQILDNAYRVTPPDGLISVSCGVSETSIWVEIRDTGPGIDEEDLPHIFEIFWRRDTAHTTPGLGLGLSITRRIIEWHGGQIVVESQVGKGTCFRINLPTWLAVSV